MMRHSLGQLGRQRLGALRQGLAAAVTGAVLGAAIGACSGAAPPSTRSPAPGRTTACPSCSGLGRVQRWQRDIAYLTRELPAVRAAGLGDVSPSAWKAAAARLEAAVPRLTDDQVAARMARMVAMLHDDETSILFPTGPVFGFEAQQFGDGLYLLAVPSADRALLGARLLAMDGRPIAQVMALTGTTIDAQDPQLLRNSEAGALDDAALLYGLGVTTSATSVVLTVQTTAGRQVTARFTAEAAGPASSTDGYIDTEPGLFIDFIEQQPGLAHVPLAPYERGLTRRPYWRSILPGQHAVYLKYNQCLPGNGFQRLAARALALLNAHQDDRLIVDLRDNPGGDSLPFQSLTAAISANPRLQAPGRVIGLVNQFTNSSATLDAQTLKDVGAVLIGQPPGDPINRWGNTNAFRLPESGIDVLYTSADINKGGTPLGLPDIVIEPTLGQTLAGDDPVLAAALSYQPGTTH